MIRNRQQLDNLLFQFSDVVLAQGGNRQDRSKIGLFLQHLEMGQQCALIFQQVDLVDHQQAG